MRRGLRADLDECGRSQSRLQSLADGFLRMSLRLPRTVVGVALLVTLAAFGYARETARSHTRQE